MGAAWRRRSAGVFQLSQRSRRLIAPVGAAAGIAAAFNTPITRRALRHRGGRGVFGRCRAGLHRARRGVAVVTSRLVPRRLSALRVPEAVTLVDPREAIVMSCSASRRGSLATLYVRAIVVLLRHRLGPRSRAAAGDGALSSPGCVVGFIGLCWPRRSAPAIAAWTRRCTVSTRGYMAISVLAKLAVAGSPSASACREGCSRRRSSLA